MTERMRAFLRDLRSARVAVPSERMRSFLRDPRNAQILVPGGLLAYGVVSLDFVIDLWSIPLAILTGLALEQLFFHLRPRADGERERTSPALRASLITSFSTLILFRSTEPWAYCAAVALGISSKFVFRVGGRHFFNPSNFGVLIGTLLLPGWIASAQWGHEVVLIFCLAGAASLILTRAARIDSALAFLGGALLFQAARHLIFGYRWEVMGHHFLDGALWIFALFMITDPRTTPRARWARILHGLTVAFLDTYLAQFHWVRDSFMWALLALAPIVPVLDFLDAKLTQREANPPPARPNAPVLPASDSVQYPRAT